MTKQEVKRLNAIVNITFIFLMGGCTFMVGYYLVRLISVSK